MCESMTSTSYPFNPGVDYNMELSVHNYRIMKSMVYAQVALFNRNKPDVIESISSAYVLLDMENT